MSGNLVAYPYFDRRYHGLPSQLTDAVSSEITRVQCPIVEIGGPTERGFRLLQDRKLLPCRPEITNAPGYWGIQPNRVDKLVDGKAMSYKPGSVGMFLASYLAIVDGFSIPVDEDTPPPERVAVTSLWENIADAEYELALENPTYNPVCNLRIGVIKEMARTLITKGLVLFEGIEHRDIEVAQALGFVTLLQTEAHGRNDLLDCVFQKTGAPHRESAHI